MNPHSRNVVQTFAAVTANAVQNAATPTAETGLGDLVASFDSNWESNRKRTPRIQMVAMKMSNAHV